MDAASTLVFMILFVSFLTARCKSEIFIEKPLLCIAFFRAQLLRQGPDSQIKRASTRKTKTLNVLVRLTSECRNKHVYCLFPWKGENPSITMFCLICLYSCTYNDEKTNQVPIFFGKTNKHLLWIHWFMDSLCVTFCQDVQPCMWCSCLMFQIHILPGYELMN